MKIGYIGLGKMGLGMATLMTEKGHEVVAYNRSEDVRISARDGGLNVKDSISEVVSDLSGQRIILIMVSHSAVDAVLDELTPILSEGDIVIDGGNSKYTETVRRAKEMSEKGFHYVDAGVSGGPLGARYGACVMVGGDAEVVEQLSDLFRDISVKDGYQYMGASGAGHFVKMVHNGIEYGMMQAIGEGFDVMKHSDFDLDLNKVVDVYQHGSVIESRLVGWLGKAYRKHGADLEGISGEVKHSGEGLWTVETAKEMNIPVQIIEKSLQFREDSQGNPTYTGQVVSALRNQFGGHDVTPKNDE